jgi:hypothetical protein
LKASSLNNDRKYYFLAGLLARSGVYGNKKSPYCS